ncbi:hypothetical protein WR25_01132 [Diploscapter pachys]|uniref:Prefoldin subunit 1 n=1 Tax=Diploscapter pachys TaxID=2018661 RepID=A0A2A2KUR6_9BILA|nr:hypothetical protein WR25_26341 [Diploscapter pachys]PAV77715.1 hypothetical protein WR25_01132 [Diploscapter pachys]
MVADEEIRKAFQDLQFRTNETRAKIAQGEVNKTYYLQKKKLAEATLKNLEPIAADLPIYRAVGRMYLLATKGSEEQRYKDDVDMYQEKYSHVEKQKEYLQKGLEDAEKNLRELIQSKRS